VISRCCASLMPLPSLRRLPSLALSSSLVALPFCSADSLRIVGSHLVLRLEAVKYASDRVGGHRGRRDFSYPSVLVHCLLGAREQFVDTHGTP
jgi:hypothetical protein